jgi:hypothetical protein
MGAMVRRFLLASSLLAVTMNHWYWHVTPGTGMEHNRACLRYCANDDDDDDDNNNNNNNNLFHGAESFLRS